MLRLLDSELTGPEIARELFVSHNTLRSHTKHIFTKLDVTSRRAAVRRARERGSRVAVDLHPFRSPCTPRKGCTVNRGCSVAHRSHPVSHIVG